LIIDSYAASQQYLTFNYQLSIINYPLEKAWSAHLARRSLIVDN